MPGDQVVLASGQDVGAIAAMNAYRWKVGFLICRWVSSPNPPWKIAAGTPCSSNMSLNVQYANESTTSPPPARVGAR